MENKLNPRQYTPYALNTPSGNLAFSLGVDFFQCYLLESLTGNFNFIGSVSINGSSLPYRDSSNIFGGEDTQILGGINNFISGFHNTILNSSNSKISGNYNLILGGEYNQIADADYALTFGNNILVNHTGACVLGDSSNSLKESMGIDSISISYTGGMFVDSPVFFHQEVLMTGGSVRVSGYDFTAYNDLYISGSGLISGDLQVFGTPYQTGSKLQNFQDVLDISGDISHRITGLIFEYRNAFSDISGRTLFRDIASTVSGETTIYSGINIRSGEYITSLNNKVSLEKTHHSLGSGPSIINKSQNSICNILNYGNYHFVSATGISEFYLNSYSIIKSSTEMPSSIDLLFGVNTSGYSYFKNPIMMNTNSNVPSSWDSFGKKGQLTWNESHLFVCTGWGTGNSGWARIPITGW